MIDQRHRTPGLHQEAQSLATLLHTITLASPDVPDQTGRSLRTTSRLLYQTLSDIAERQVPGERITQLRDEAIDLASSILKELSSPEISSSIGDPERSHTIDSCTKILESLRHPIGLVETTSFIPDQSTGEAHPGIENPATSESLRGKVVLITRPLSQSKSLVMMVERLGGLPVVIPMIEIVDPDDWYPVDHAIVNLNGYDGVIFTSQNGVERFVRRIQFVNVAALKILATRRVYAVGEKTRASLENAQIPVTLVPERYSANDLASALQKEPLAGKRFLFPKGRLAKEEIPAALEALHAVVDQVEVYTTVGSVSSTFGALNLAMKNGEIDALTFFSPSAVRNFSLAVTLEHTAHSVIACVGPSTAEAALSVGFAKIVTAPEATAESLIGALIRYYDR